MLLLRLIKKEIPSVSLEEVIPTQKERLSNYSSLILS
jgi:hypothetical protein